MRHPLQTMARTWAAALLLGILATGCGGGGGNGAPPQLSVTISASSAAVASGGTTTLTWSSSNATSCTASGNWSGARPLSGTEVTAPINAGAAYTLTCTGSSGMTAATANVAILTKPTVTISATPNAVMSGGTTTLTWSTTDATSCTASDSWSGPRPTSGTEVTAALTKASAFTLTCTGPGGSAAATASVAVTPAPTVTLNADPSAITSGGGTTLSWASTDATNCVASGGWFGPRGTSGTEAIAGLSSATAFTLSCSGIGGTGAATANVTLINATAAPSVTLTADPTSVASGTATNLRWSTSDATSCTASGGWSGSRATSGTETPATITTATAYTLSCVGPGGTGAATVNVAILPKPTVTISATPSAVASGSSTTLNWSSTNAVSCVASGGWSGARPTSGNEVPAPITTATNYTLTCTGPGGVDAASANVSIAPTPTVTIAATPSSVVSGGATTLTWSSTDATSCLASGSWSGPRGTSGSEMRTNLTMDSAFTLTCTGVGGMGAATANVTITAPTPQPTVTITANPLTVASGGSTTLMWSTTNATACTASGSWNGPRGTSGSEARVITAASSFTLSCTGSGGSGSGTVNVALAQAAGGYTTNFPLNETPIAEGGNWSRRTGQGFTNVVTENGAAFGTNGVTDTFDDSYALLRGSFGANQTAEATVRRSNNLDTRFTHEVELLLRFTDDTTTARGYECLFSFDGIVQIIRWDGLNLGNMMFEVLRVEGAGRAPGALRTGDVVKASINGDLISVFVNGTEVGRARDSTYSSGQPGIGFFTRPGGSSRNLAITSYKVTSGN